MSEIGQSAIGKWPGILLQLGIGAEFLQNKHGPCPVCGGRDRYRFDDKGGTGSYYCGHCGPGDGFKLLMRVNGWDFKTAAQEVEKLVGRIAPVPVRQKPDPRLLLRRVGKGARRVAIGDHVGRYLAGRGLSVMPDALYCHAGLDYYDNGTRAGNYPAMLAMIQGIDGEPLTYHATYLDGPVKAQVESPKKILPPLKPITGGAIRLFPAAEHLGIAEGIETAIAAYELHGIPTWATATANGMESFQVPEGVGEITIFADNDATFTGHKAAYTLANRLVVREGIDANVIVSETGDMLDDLNARAEAGSLGAYEDPQSRHRRLHS